jgi:hypothetical protein
VTTVGQGLGLEPVYPWDRPRPIPSETMMSIQALQPTAAAMLVSPELLPETAAAAAEVRRLAVGT